MPANSLLLSSSPSAFAGGSTRKVMAAVIVALLPTTVYGIVLYGVPALLVVLTSVATSVLSEWGFRALVRKPASIGDLSAVVTGLLLALVIPATTPLWMVALGAVFAIVVVKEFFGGLGANPFNPALAGRAMLLMSFPAALTAWTVPFAADAVATATPLGVYKTAEQALVQAGSGAAEAASGAMAQLLDAVGASDMGGLYWTMFLGNRSGSLGESSILLILVGAALLLALGVIQWIIPVAMIGSVFLGSWALGLDPVLAVLSGGVVLGAFFMATDYSSSPMTPKGKAIFGVGAGLLTVLIRRFGAFPEGVTYGILLMNAITPFLDKLRVKKFGFVPPAKPAKEAAK